METSQHQEPQLPAWKQRFRLLWNYFQRLVHLNEDTDFDTTKNSISKSVEFKGINTWILFFAIILASIGLNVNSTAVIIGAMLISPVMGPITGVGFSIGTYDVALLQKSLRNLAIMVLISLIASTLYFILSPLSDAQSELLARTKPTIFDVLIAFFGGCAGFIATSRKDQPFTIISGVAIATALMPPLCTAGFGLATLQFKYFLGAFYLFFINSFFIALATFILTKYLKFPISQFVNPAREKIVRRSISLFAIIVIIPSIFLAINVVKESSFNNQVIKYVADIQKNDILKETQIINYKKEYHKKGSTLNLFLVGKELKENEINLLRNIMANDYGLTATELNIKQASQITDQDIPFEEILNHRENEIHKQEQRIGELTQQMDSLRAKQTEYDANAKIIGDKYRTSIAAIFITEIGYYQPDSKQSHIYPTIYIKWKDGARDTDIIEELQSWAPLLLQVEKVKIVEQ